MSAWPEKEEEIEKSKDKNNSGKVRIGSKVEKARIKSRN